MSKNPNFKADMVVFGLFIFLLGVVFSVFVLEKDPDARLGLFGISIWVLVIVGALYMRKRSAEKDAQDDEASKDDSQK
ncbi:exported hypothetical protein [Candidatus Terasakiella magnetica]|uniref:Uncharacterized protein n=1 Tax=Candidatus Terasakiella magnetica TaxID=1867952 RepID=A0A1C3RIN8_9PROT|nr:hypothetical protein [Candidatus Terasakiella magnetica]SCA57064.1 exported hypothetical protein [Candidatus Terasakiella magnetica]